MSPDPQKFQLTLKIIKSKGLIGGHLNIISIVSKTKQLESLLTDSFYFRIMVN